MMPPNANTQLERLSEYLADPAAMFRHARWLLSDFNSPIWEINIDTKANQFIDWNVMLEDGSTLLTPKNAGLIAGLRTYLVAVTRNSTDMSIETNSNKFQRVEFDRACHIIDHLLLNSHYYELGKYGLEALNKDHLISILKRTCDFGDPEGFFEWQPSVGKLAQELMSATPPESIDQVLRDTPGIDDVTFEQEDENLLGIAPGDLPRARAALFVHGYMHKVGTVWKPNHLLLSGKLYKNTLVLKTRHRGPIDALCFGGKPSKVMREYPAVAWSTRDDELPAYERLASYQRTIYKLGVLHEAALPAPPILGLRETLLYEHKLAKGGRHRSLPSAVALGAMRKSIEFHLQHGKHLVDSFCLLALHSVRTGKPPAHFKNDALAKIIRKETTQLGVDRAAAQIPTTRPSLEEYHSRFREHPSLIELLRVYIGSVQIVVGALMARRVGELKDLKTLGCLDSSELWLMFLNRKSTKGLRGLRQLKARPIDPLGAQMIKNLIRMQKILKRIGYIDSIHTLFATPCSRGSKNFSNSTKEIFTKNLDIFCDFFEMPLNAQGQRYYIRQHQLRRFFAMLFFHTNSFGSLETLQWMLAHTDKSHVWHYITESMDGVALMGAKAQFVAEQIQHGDNKSYQNLEKLLQERYGTADFALVDADELEDEITELLKDGSVTIEPVFFNDENGEQMRVIVKVIGGENE